MSQYYTHPKALKAYCFLALSGLLFGLAELDAVKLSSISVARPAFYVWSLSSFLFANCQLFRVMVEYSLR